MVIAYVADTLNGRKLIIASEELDPDYRVRHVDLRAGGQFAPAFLHHLGRATGKRIADEDVVPQWRRRARPTQDEASLTWPHGRNCSRPGCRNRDGLRAEGVGGIAGLKILEQA